MFFIYTFIGESPPSYRAVIKISISLQFSDDEEETKRVVRSTKEKRYEEIANLIKLIRNYKKIKDMSSMLTSK